AWMAVLYRPADDPTRVYFGTDTRTHVILVGALLAVVLDRRVGRASTRATSLVAQLCGVIAVAGVIGAMTLVHDHDPLVYRGGFTLFATGVAVIIASVVVDPGGL